MINRFKRDWTNFDGTIGLSTEVFAGVKQTGLTTRMYIGVIHKHPYGQSKDTVPYTFKDHHDETITVTRHMGNPLLFDIYVTQRETI